MVSKATYTGEGRFKREIHACIANSFTNGDDWLYNADMGLGLLYIIIVYSDN